MADKLEPSDHLILDSSSSRHVHAQTPWGRYLCAFKVAEERVGRVAVLDEPSSMDVALQGFLRAWELDTTFTAALVRAASAYHSMGLRRPADSLAALVHVRRDDLTETGLTQLDLLRAILRGDRQAALVQARRSGGGFVAMHAIADNRPREALVALDTLLLSWKDSTLHRATAHHMLGEHAPELEAVRRDRLVRPESFSLVVTEIRARAALGHVQEVESLIEEAEGLAPERRWMAMDPMSNAVVELRTHGYHDAAREVAQRLVQWFASGLHDDTTVAYRFRQATALYIAEQWSDAREAFETLAADLPQDVNIGGYLGVLAARRGDTKAAEDLSASLVGLNDRYDFGRDVYWQACIASLLGDPQRALALLRTAYARGRAFSIELHRDMDLYPLHGYRPFEAFLRPKG